MTTIPKIIRVKNETFKDNLTMFHAKDQDISLSKHWSEWASVVTTFSDYEKWKNVSDIFAMVIVKPEDINIEKFFAGKLNVSYLFISYKLLTLQPREFWTKFPNVFFIEEISMSYPYIQPIWNGTTDDAIACIAHLFRFSRIVNIHPSEERLESLAKISCSVENDILPPNLYIMTQYFIHSNSKRAREIRKCLMNNCSNKFIDKIILLNETDLSAEWKSFKHSDKIEQHIIGSRLTYADLIKATIEHIPKNTIIAYLNADIYLDDSIHHVYTLNMRDKMLALLRWDTTESGEEPKLFGPHPDSQDTWIVFSDSVQERKWDFTKLGYQLGRAGCDNRFTFDMFSNRFLICNPAKTIKTLHIHKSEIRNYDRTDITPSPYYIYSYPSEIADIHYIRNLDSPEKVLDYTPFDVIIKCPNAANGVTWCTMISRMKRYVWNFNEAATYSKKLSINHWKNCFISDNGIVHDIRNIYIGQNVDKFLSEYKVNLSVDIISKKKHYANILAIPTGKPNIYKNIDIYLLFYLARALFILSEYPDYNIFMPQAIQDELDNLSLHKIKTIPYIQNQSYYADNIVGYAPEILEVGREDIEHLRKVYPEWKESAADKTCIILTDEETPINSIFVSKIQEMLGSEWKVDMINVSKTGFEVYKQLTGKKLCIVFGGPNTEHVWTKLWSLPKRAKVIEFQNELKTNGECQHMLSACNYDNWIITLHKGTQEEMTGQAVKHFQKWLDISKVDL
jgi:hypothetical protein